MRFVIFTLLYDFGTLKIVQFCQNYRHDFRGLWGGRFCALRAHSINLSTHPQKERRYTGIRGAHIMEFADHEAASARRRAFMREQLLQDDTDDEDLGQRRKEKRSNSYRTGGFGRQPRNEDAGLTGKNRWRVGAGHEESTWWRLLENDDTFISGTAAARKFYEYFGVPRLLYEQYFAQASKVPCFMDKEAGVNGHRGPSTQPLRIKLLAALTRLVTGCKFTLLEDIALISARILEHFYRDWTKFRASPDVFLQSVYPPRTEAEAHQSLLFHERLGLPGVCCGFDGVTYERGACPAHLTASCKDKAGKISVMFNGAGDLHCVTGLYGPDYGGRNDKTAARMDPYMLAIKEGTEYGGVDYGKLVYHVYDLHGKRLQKSGALAVVDNGYHKWKKLICPEKPHNGEEWLSRLSERLESVRKLESECHFGKVNKRFAELRKPFMCRTMQQIGHIVRTCYGIHNDIIRQRGLHLLHQPLSNWSSVAIDQDPIRVFAPKRGSIPLVHVGAGLTDAVGNDLFVEHQPGWQETRTELMHNFQVQFTHKRLLWPKTVRSILGHTLRHGVVDNRPLARGSAAQRHHDEEHDEEHRADCSDGFDDEDEFDDGVHTG